MPKRFSKRNNSIDPRPSIESLTSDISDYIPINEKIENLEIKKIKLENELEEEANLLDEKMS